ncbi:MAG: putative addiction module antidote protein [Treponematales bacterium]
MEKIRKWDAAEAINTKEDVLALLEAALEENDTKLLYSVIGDIARSKGMTKIARELNLNREGLYESLSEKGNPSFVTMTRVLDNMGFKVRLEYKKAS